MHPDDRTTNIIYLSKSIIDLFFVFIINVNYFNVIGTFEKFDIVKISVNKLKSFRKRIKEKITTTFKAPHRKIFFSSIE